MAEIIKTWPASLSARVAARIFGPMPSFSTYFFTIGRGKPKDHIDRLWFTYQGRILGSFHVAEVIRNDGSLPRLHRLDGAESAWQMNPDAWIAVCPSSCKRLRERVYMSGFRGWRYFSIDSYRLTPDARVR